MTWLLLIYFAGRASSVEIERFETEALCRAAGSAVVQMYNDQQFVRQDRPWRCVHLESPGPQR